MTAFDYLHRSVKATYPCPECSMNDIDRHLSRVSKTQGDPSREKPVEMRRNGVFDAVSILATSLEKLMEAPAFASHQMPTNTLSRLPPDGQEYHKLIASFAI